MTELEYLRERVVELEGMFDERSSPMNTLAMRIKAAFDINLFLARTLAIMATAWPRAIHSDLIIDAYGEMIGRDLCTGSEVFICLVRKSLGRDAVETINRTGLRRLSDRLACEIGCKLGAYAPVAIRRRYTQDLAA